MSVCCAGYGSGLQGFLDESGLDFNGFINKGLDILGASVTDQPYYARNPNIATQTTSVPVFDPNARQRQIAIQQQQAAAAVSATDRGVGFNINNQTLLIGGLVLFAVLFGKGRR
jgi:hypothetical protein